MALFLPQKWRQQPQYPVEVDESNEYADGVIFALNGAQSRPVYSRPITYGVSQAVATRGYGRNGVGPLVSASGIITLKRISAGGGDGFIEWAAGSDLSSMFVIDNMSVGPGNPGIYRNNGGVGNSFFIRNGGTAQFWLRVNGSDFTGVGTFPTSGNHTVGHSIKSGARIDIYTDGVATYSTTTAVTTEDTSGVFGISALGVQGNPGSSTERSYGAYPWTVFWTRWWPPEAWAELYRAPWQILRRNPRRVYFLPTFVATPQLAYPASDITTASWQSSLGGSLFAAIDEPTTPDDADFVYSPNDPTTQEFEVKFGPLDDPTIHTGHILRYRLQSLWQDATFVMTLMCGATQIAQWTESVAASVAPTTYAKTLTSLEAAAITDYTDLRLRGKASA